MILSLTKPRHTFYHNKILPDKTLMILSESTYLYPRIQFVTYIITAVFTARAKSHCFLRAVLTKVFSVIFFPFSYTILTIDIFNDLYFVIIIQCQQIPHRSPHRFIDLKYIIPPDSEYDRQDQNCTIKFQWIVIRHKQCLVRLKG